MEYLTRPFQAYVTNLLIDRVVFGGQISNRHAYSAACHPRYRITPTRNILPFAPPSNPSQSFDTHTPQYYVAHFFVFWRVCSERHLDILRRSSVIPVLCTDHPS